MFQYAFGKAKSLELGVPLVLDASLYAMKNFGTDTPREYRLDNFNIESQITTVPIGFAGKIAASPFWRRVDRNLAKLGIQPFRRFAHYCAERGMRYQKFPYFPPRTYYYGFFQSEKYFKNIGPIIRKSFTLSKAAHPQFVEFTEKMQRTESVSIHIRRGDFITHTGSIRNVGFATLSYFQSAIQLMENKKPNLTFFVFSDDITWAKENLKTSKPVEYVSQAGFQDYEEILLMGNCKHHILSNSSFSWWGAWMNTNTNKTVIRPKKWWNDPKLSSADLTPPEWLVIDN